MKFLFYIYCVYPMRFTFGKRRKGEIYVMIEGDILHIVGKYEPGKYGNTKNGILRDREQWIRDNAFIFGNDEYNTVKSKIHELRIKDRLERAERRRRTKMYYHKKLDRQYYIGVLEDK